MKKIVAMFAITMMLVLPVFGQQATTVTPTQAPKPAKKGRATTVKPSVAVPVQQESLPAANVATVVPARPTAATVQAITVAPAKATDVTEVEAVQVTPTPTAQAAPSANVRIATPPTVQATPRTMAPVAPAVAAQSLSGTATPQPQVASTRPAGVTISQQATTPTASAPAAKVPDYVSEKGFKGKVFEVKYRDPYLLLNAVSSLGSGFKGSEVRANGELKTITVRDFPENIATIEEALKRLDTAQAPRPDIEFRLQVLIGSDTPIQGEEYPSDLKDVLQQLLSSLKYKNYSLMIASTHRTKEGGQGVSNNGVAESKLFNVSVPSGNQIFYEYNIGQINLDASTSAGTTVQIGNFSFGLRIPLVIGGPNSPIQYQNVGFRSPVSLREGEKVVVGTTTMGDKGLIVVLTAKINK